jgi:hypothetical protein
VLSLSWLPWISSQSILIVTDEKRQPEKAQSIPLFSLFPGNISNSNQSEQNSVLINPSLTVIILIPS